MNIASLKQFSKIELIHTLMDCAAYLERAYQETSERDFWLAAVQASFACDFLQYEEAVHQKDYSIH